MYIHHQEYTTYLADLQRWVLQPQLQLPVFRRRPGGGGADDDERRATITALQEIRFYHLLR